MAVRARFGLRRPPHMNPRIPGGLTIGSRLDGAGVTLFISACPSLPGSASSLEAGRAALLTSISCGSSNFQQLPATVWRKQSLSQTGYGYLYIHIYIYININKAGSHMTPEKVPVQSHKAQLEAMPTLTTSDSERDFAGNTNVLSNTTTLA